MRQVKGTCICAAAYARYRVLARSDRENKQISTRFNNYFKQRPSMVYPQEQKAIRNSALMYFTEMYGVLYYNSVGFVLYMPYRFQTSPTNPFDWTPNMTIGSSQIDSATNPSRDSTSIPYLRALDKAVKVLCGTHIPM